MINIWRDIPLVTAGLDLALAAVQLAQPFGIDRRVALTPLMVTDASGQLTAGAGLTGRF
jgi:hypothetical protein